MNVFYKISKKWHVFWWKYHVTFQLKRIAKLFIFLLVVWLVGSLMIILSQNLTTPGFSITVDDLKYFQTSIILLVSGFDINSSYLNTYSHGIAILILIFGLIFVGLVTGQIISIFMDAFKKREYFPEKPPHFQFKNPIVICGINSKLKNIIKEIRNDPDANKNEIIIVDEKANEIEQIENIKNVWHHKGNPSDRRVLEKIMGKDSTIAIILANSEVSANSVDSKSIQIALAFESFVKKDIYTIIEIVDPYYKVHLSTLKINEWVSTQDFMQRLVAQTAIQPGILEVFEHLLSEYKENKKTNDVQFSTLPNNKKFDNKSFLEIKKELNKNTNLDFILLGFSKYLKQSEKEQLSRYFKQDCKNGGKLCLRHSNYFNQINPVNVDSTNSKVKKINNEIYLTDRGMTSKTLLNKLDRLIYIAPDKINFNKALSN